MSLDGALLRHLKNELYVAKGCRVTKIYQPSLNEIILVLRGREDSYKLLISCSANGARAHFTQSDIENPQSPPMFCMLLRKKLPSAKFVGLRQVGLERALYFDFESKNEMGDIVNVTLVSEIMGKYSNIILVSQEGRIIDSIRRVSPEMSSKRTILPGDIYLPPPPQNKLNVMDSNIDQIIKDVLNIKGDIALSKGLSLVLQGISLIACESIADISDIPKDIKISGLEDNHISCLRSSLLKLQQIIKECSGAPYMALNSSKNPCDISFIRPSGNKYKQFNAFSIMLDSYYYERARNERIASKTSGLLKKVNNIISRRQRKISIQEKELIQCRDRDKYRMYGDILTGSIHLIKKGASNITLNNFYSEISENISIPLDPSLSGSGNAQKYYKRYRKSCNAVNKLTEEIKRSREDIEYLENIIDYLSRCESDAELMEIKRELIDQGYIKKTKEKKIIKVKATSPIEFISNEGFKVYVGRNSKQNEKITFKLSKKDDIWFHVKDVPGTHTILVAENKEVPEKALLFAASLCALHSKARDSSNVAVDYTNVRNVKRMPGGKPGMVNYTNYKTIFVTPDKSILDKYKV